MDEKVIKQMNALWKISNELPKYIKDKKTYTLDFEQMEALNKLFIHLTSGSIVEILEK